MFARTTDNMRTLRVDLLSGISFSDFELELYNFLAITNVLLNKTINNTITNLNSYEILNGTSINTLNTNLNSYEILTGVSWGVQLSTNQYLQNEIDSLVLAGVSIGNLDYSYGISIAVLDQKIGNQIGVTNDYFSGSIYSLGTSTSAVDSKLGVVIGNTVSPLGISMYWIELHKQDKIACSTSFAEMQLDVNNININ